MSSIFKNIFSKQLEVKISDETDLNLKQNVEPLLDEIITDNVREKLKGKKVEIIIPENFGKAVYKYSVAEEKEHYDKYGYSNSQGHFAAPLTENGNDFKVIVNKSTFEELQYFSTVYHEFTHVVDFTDYIKQYGNPMTMTRKEKLQNYYFEFYLWAEFNAKKIGIERILIEYDKKDWVIDLPRSTSIFIADVQREVDSVPRLYNLMHYFARISACDDGLLTLDSQIYPKSYLVSNFGANATVIHNTMEGIRTFAEFEKEKDFIKHLFKW